MLAPFRGHSGWLIPLGSLLLAAIWLAPVAQAHAQEGQVTELPGLRDEFQRRGMTYFDTHVHPSSEAYLSSQEVQRITAAVRSQIDTLGRFDDIEPVGVRTETPTDFVRALQEHLLEHEEEIARIRREDLGQDYNFEFRDTIVTGEAMQQVLNSAYAYQVTIDEVRLHREEGPYETLAPRLVAQVPFDAQALSQMMPDLRGTKLSYQHGTLTYASREPMSQAELEQLRTLVAEPAWQQAIENLFDQIQEAAEAGAYQEVPVTYTKPYYVARLPVIIEFFKIEVVDEADNIVPADQAVVPVAEGRNTYTAEARQDGVVIEPGSELYLDIALAEGETTAEEWARDSVEQGRHSATQRAAEAAPSRLARLDVWVRRIPEFQIRAQIVEQFNGYVGMLPGRSEDLYLDQWFRLYIEGEPGERVDLGWTKIRHVGPGYQALGGGATAAEEERTELQVYTGDPEIGFMLGEYATFGAQIDLRLSFDFLSGHSGASGLAFANLFVGGSLARSLGLSEFYAGLEGGLGFGTNLSAWYVAARLAKKFFLSPGAWLLEVSGGLGLTQIEDTSSGAQSNPFVLIEPRGRLIYWISPHFEVYLDGSLRIGLGDTGAGATGGNSWRPIGLALGIGLSGSF